MDSRWTAATIVVVAVYVVEVIYAIGGNIAALHRTPSARLSSLHVYMNAVHAVAHGTPLYSYGANSGPFTYPPFAVLMMWPIGWLPEPALVVAWTAAVCASTAVAAGIIIRQAGRAPRSRAAALIAVGAVLLLSAPFQSNLYFGQVSVFVAVAAFLDVAGKTPYRLRGVLVGCAAAVKLTPLLFVPYLLFTGQRRAACQAMGVFAVGTVLGAVILPGDSARYWTQEVLATSRMGDVTSTSNQSLNGILLRLPLVPAHREAAWLLLTAVVCATALYRAAVLHREDRTVEAAVVVGCAALAISPVSWIHHQVWTVLAGLLLFTRPRYLRHAAAALIIILVMTVPLPRITGSAMAAMVGFLTANARGLCCVAVCFVGLIAAWQAARTSMTQRAVAYLGTAGLLVATSVVATGFIRVSVSSPNGYLDSANWRSSSGYNTTLATGQIIAYTATNRPPPALTVVGTAAPSVARLVLKPTHNGSEAYSVPLAPSSQPGGAHAFAFGISDATDARLIAYDSHGRPIRGYRTALSGAQHRPISTTQKRRRHHRAAS